MGDMYQGEWAEGRFDGYGEKTMCDGSLIKGSFRAGDVHGWALKAFSFGDRYTGMFERDCRCGYGW